VAAYVWLNLTADVDRLDFRNRGAAGVSAGSFAFDVGQWRCRVFGGLRWRFYGSDRDTVRSTLARSHAIQVVRLLCDYAPKVMLLTDPM